MSDRTEVHGSPAAWQAVNDHGGGEDLTPARGSAAARVYRPNRNLMQSGRVRTRQWVLELEPMRPQAVDPLMGWVGSTDPLQQISLRFPDKDSALRFAEKQGWTCTVWETAEPRPKPHSYASNFRWKGEPAPVGRAQPVASTGGLIAA